MQCTKIYFSRVSFDVKEVGWRGRIEGEERSMMNNLYKKIIISLFKRCCSVWFMWMMYFLERLIENMSTGRSTSA